MDPIRWRSRNFRYGLSGSLARTTAVATALRSDSNSRAARWPLGRAAVIGAYPARRRTVLSARAASTARAAITTVIGDPSEASLWRRRARRDDKEAAVTMGRERTAQQVDDELDDMCLRMVGLMDDYCSTVGRLERCLRDGCVHLAKSRYVMGNSAVSDLQLPTCGPYAARSTVVRDGQGAVRLAHDAGGDDPVKRFGVLVPGSLRAAQRAFCDCLASAVEAAAIRNEMEKVQTSYAALKGRQTPTTVAVGV